MAGTRQCKAATRQAGNSVCRHKAGRQARGLGRQGVQVVKKAGKAWGRRQGRQEQAGQARQAHTRGQVGQGCGWKGEGGKGPGMARRHKAGTGRQEQEGKAWAGGVAGWQQKADPTSLILLQVQPHNGTQVQEGKAYKKGK